MMRESSRDLHTSTADQASDDHDMADSLLWNELVDRLVAQGESVGDAVVMADEVVHARHLREQASHESGPPRSSVRCGEEPLG